MRAFLFCVTLVAALAAAGRPGQGNADKALGEYLWAECVTCHQLTGQHQGIPAIVGWPVDLFIETMEEYRKKKRANQIMQTIAGRLSAEEIAALAAYLAGIPPRTTN